MRDAQVPIELDPTVSRKITQGYPVTDFRKLSYMAGTLGSRIRTERKSRKLTLGELSKACGVSPSMLSDLEHDRSHGSTRLHEIAAALVVNPAWLSTGLGHKAVKTGVGEPEARYFGYALSPEAAQVAAEYEKLEEPLRSTIRELIETLVAKQIRKARKEPAPDKVRLRAESSRQSR